MILAIERGSTRSGFVENSLWNMLWNWCKTDNRRNEVLIYISGPGSSVGIETENRLNGSGIKSRWGARISALVQTGPGAHPDSCTMGARSFMVVEAATAWG
jgi:hypothetical protein